MKEQKGMVYLVGAGPGDPGLITVRGRQLVSQAEVLVYDRLASEEFLNCVPEDCEKIYVGKKPGCHSMKQEEISRLLTDKAMEGKMVVRLKGGDPFVFGRGGEEILELSAHGIPYEVVPGVTSAIAAPAHAGIPVTHRLVSQSFHVITGHTALSGDTLTGGFREYAKLPGTLVFLMGLSNLEQIVRQLIHNGKSPDTPAAVVTDGTMPQERCVRAPLSELPAAVRKAGLRSPGVIVIGPTASFEMNCRGERLLSGISIGITGTDAIFEKLSVKLAALGAKVVRASVSHVVPEQEERLRQTVRELSAWDWAVFTSRNAVSLFFRAIKDTETDFRTLAHLKFAVVGKGTGDYLKTFGFCPDYMPDTYTTEALAAGLVQTAAPEERVLIPRARQGSKVLTDVLEAHGREFLDLSVYDIRTEDVPEDVLEGLDYITFESGSGVRGFFRENPEAGRKLFETVCPVCIGQVTADALRSMGVDHAVVARTYTADGIIEAILQEKEHGRIPV